MHIELKFCIWLCFTVIQIKFECHHFASIFVGVMPLLELRIMEIHSFSLFSLTCFDILRWNFTYVFVLLYYRLSLSVLIRINCCRSYAPFGTSSRAPGLTSGLQGSVNVHRGALLLVPQWQCISSFVFYIRILEIHSFPHFSPTCFDILSWNFAYVFVLLYYRLSLSVLIRINCCRSYAPFGT